MPKLIEIPESTQTDEELDEEILEIFVDEAHEVLAEIIDNFSEWSENPGNLESLKTLRRAFHTLKGSGRLVGAMAVGELGWRFEELFNNLLNNAFSQNDKIIKLVGQIKQVLPAMIEDFKAQRPISRKAHILISQAHYLTQSKGQELVEFDDSADVDADVAKPTLSESTLVSKPIIKESSTDELATSVEEEESIESEEELEFQNIFPESREDFTVDSTKTEKIDDIEDDGKIDSNLLEIFKNESNQHLLDIRNILEIYESGDFIPIDHQLERLFHTLNGSSLSVDFSKISNIAGPMENYARTLVNHKIKVTPEILEIFQESVELIDNLLNNDEYYPEREKALLSNIEDSLKSILEIIKSDKPKDIEKSTSARSRPKEEDFAVPPEAADEFMEIFLDEAEEILENTQSLLERWQSSPSNMELMKELQRELHTLKGGARMVGIIQMGDLSHKLESVLTQVVEGNAKSSAELQDIIQSSVDELAAMLEMVKAGAPLSSPSELIDQIESVLNPNLTITEKTSSKLAPISKIKKSEDPVVKAEPPKVEREREGEMVDAEDRIRVRVSLIDKLTQLAQNLSVSRTHMEQKQGFFKNNLDEMEQTIIRLKDQLRRLDIETEAQILSHYQDVTREDDEEFDPLELDRFSLLQQLSRSLMESVSDLISIQDYLRTLARQTETLLIQEARTGAELQENIMRTRMIPFSRISPRLQRIARLTAKELKKQVDFIINGEDIEFERTVLNRIVAPMEHMLRNALDHGIETKEVRQQMGKSLTAKVTIDISKEGTDINIKFSDDGAGLNLAAIRKKAEERGIIKPDQVVDDYALMQFILEPAFSTAQITSTAKKVTQTSGRGVGMDVVNSEIKQLGGNLQIFSKTGKGTLFEIHLPLSLTVNKALMVYVGEEMLSVPLNNIVAVMRIPRQEVIFEGDKARYYKYMDKNYRIFHLGEILGFGRVSLDSALIPTLLIRSAGRCVALLVDGIEGRREIIVKPVGPQISAISWIGGATVLGDGRVVLILDVPALTRIESAPQYEQQFVETKKEEKKTVAPLIMVVDDSITVRKVTTRLLKRQGMDVIAAKDGVDAVALLQESIPNLMLLDIEMPRMDGYELAIQVRNTPNLKHIPIIMITSRSGEKHRTRAEKIGVNRYLGKPFNEKELLQTINALLQESFERTQNRRV